MHRGVATFTLDSGKCLKWLFKRMVKLGREIIRVMIHEFGAEEFVRRIGDPVWVQSLYQDPARFSFAHGGKDGSPYFTDRSTYDQSIGLLKK